MPWAGIQAGPDPSGMVSPDGDDLRHAAGTSDWAQGARNQRLAPLGPVRRETCNMPKGFVSERNLNTRPSDLEIYLSVGYSRQITAGQGYRPSVRGGT